MDRKVISWKARYYFQYFPFTLHSIVCALAAWGGVKLLYQRPGKGASPSALLPFILIMGKVVFLFILALVALSVLSTFYSYLYFLYLNNVRGSKLEVSFSSEVKKGRNRLYLEASIPGAIRPLLGFVKGRLFYDDNIFTDRFPMLSDKKREHTFWRTGIMGKSRVYLPDIKEYELKGGFVYFEDMLHLVKLAVSQPLSGHFHQSPVLLGNELPTVLPRKTETMEFRVEELHRVEGEYLNYKDFEAGDDVRRIVWQVYARNRELMVRTPEQYEPYASHLYFYASFCSHFKAGRMQAPYMREMLNYYKNNVWTIYDALSQKEWHLRYIPDLNFSVPGTGDEREEAAGIISRSYWHTEPALSAYYKPRSGSAFCISSLTDPADLAELLDHCDPATMVYFVQLSGVFRRYAAINMLRRLIFLPPADRLSRLRSKWVFSPLRLKVRKKEKEIQLLLEKSGVTFVTL